MSSLEFARPWVLFALALVPLYLWLRLRARRGRVVGYAPLQYRPAAAGRAALGRLRLPLEVVLVAVLVTALAGPSRVDRVELLEEEGIDVVLVLDISLSMLARDFEPDRLQALREIAAGFVRRSAGNRVGVVVFARDAWVQTPLTTDHFVLLDLLEGVTVDAIDQAKSGGTAIGDALLVAAEHLERNRIEGRDQAAVLITDGESNLGSDPVLGARYLVHTGARFYSIGIGGTEPIEVFVDGERLGGDDPYLAILDDAELRAMAEATGGRFFRATDEGALAEIFGELGRLESAPLEAREVEIERSWAPRLALAALLLFPLHLLLSGVVARRPYR